LSIFELRRGPE